MPNHRHSNNCRNGGSPRAAARSGERGLLLQGVVVMARREGWQVINTDPASRVTFLHKRDVRINVWYEEAKVEVYYCDPAQGKVAETWIGVDFPALRGVLRCPRAQAVGAAPLPGLGGQSPVLAPLSLHQYSNANVMGCQQGVPQMEVHTHASTSPYLLHPNQVIVHQGIYQGTHQHQGTHQVGYQTMQYADLQARLICLEQGIRSIREERAEVFELLQQRGGNASPVSVADIGRGGVKSSPRCLKSAAALMGYIKPPSPPGPSRRRENCHLESRLAHLEEDVRSILKEKDDILALLHQSQGIQHVMHIEPGVASHRFETASAPTVPAFSAFVPVPAHVGPPRVAGPAILPGNALNALEAFPR